MTITLSRLTGRRAGHVRLIMWVACVWMLLGAVIGHAQTIDPSVLQRLQNQLGTDAQSSPPLPQDVQPGQGAQRDAGDTALPGQRIDTNEEQEVRRAEARRQLRELYDPSAVEQDYRLRTGDRTLRQFGYDFFRAAPPPTGVRTGAIGDDYILGIGDEIQVSFRGATNSSQMARVDRDGRIVVGQLPPIQAAGRSLGTVKAQIASATERTLLATDAYVSVGNVRSISVFVGGEVERPGQFSLTSLADVGTAIAQAGGVRRSGSLRHVRIVRAGGASQTVDLYGLLGIGAAPTVRLRDGDRVIVPVIGPTVAVTGSVPRPGIYELRGAASVGEVVAFAGGAIRQRGAQVVISRISADGTETFIRAPDAGSRVMGGDAVQIIGGSPGGAIGRVRLAGHVDNAGSRPLIAAGTIAELLGPQENLRPDTYQLAAVLLRQDPKTGSRQFEIVNLAQELRGLSATTLRSEDQLFVFSRMDIEFMNSTIVRQIVLGQPNPSEECVPLVRLAQLVKDSDSTRFNAITRAGFVQVTAEGSRLATVGGLIGQGGGRRNPEGRNFEEEERAKQKDEGTEEDPLCPSVFVLEPDLLPILIEHAISVGGSVRRPAAYPVGGQVTARDLAAVADGLLGGSSGLVLDVNRAIPGPVERVRVDQYASTMQQTILAAGDDIRFNAQQPVFEGSAVLLSGEVARPGLYSIRKGERLSELLARAGGLTSYAYPYGTIFTRRSVKEAQEEGYRRTAREMNSGLLAIAARSQSGSAEGVLGAAQLIQTLSTSEAPGRMVVEADPRVLALRPDLDTIMEPGDSVFVPKRPNFVLALGDVGNAGALQFVEGKLAAEYLSEAGGTLSTADRKRVFVVLPNGTAQPASVSGWAGDRSLSPPPGSTIIVPKNIDPLFRLGVIRDITTIVAQLLTSVATVAVLATN